METNTIWQHENSQQLPSCLSCIFAQVWKKYILASFTEDYEYTIWVNFSNKNEKRRDDLIVPTKRTQDWRDAYSQVLKKRIKENKNKIKISWNPLNLQSWKLESSRK